MRRAIIGVLLSFCVSGFLWAQDLSWRDYDSPVRLAQLIQTRARPYLLLDVRGLAEYQAGHIPSAVNLPLAALVKDGIDAAPDSLIIVYCASGTRSGQASRFLADRGYTRIIDFGSIHRWEGPIDVEVPGE